MRIHFRGSDVVIQSVSWEDNPLFSAVFGGTPLDAVSKVFSTGEVFLSPDVIKEIDGTIHRLSPKLGEEKADFLSGTRREAIFLITGDKDLLAVDPEKVAVLPDRLRIVTPRRFLEIGPDVP